MKNHPKTKVGIIGVGRMGVLHLQKFMQLSGTEVTGVFDTNEGRRNAISRDYCIPVYTCLSDLLFESDAVVIATPTASHGEIAKQALDAGVHVLIEKPMTLRIEEAEELVSNSKKRGLVLQVGFLERFRFSSLLEGVPIREITGLNSYRHTTGPGRDLELDVIMDLLIHDLDLALSIAGKFPSEVYAKGFSVQGSKMDFATVQLIFGKGASFLMQASRISVLPRRSMDLWATGFFVSLDFTSNAVAWYTDNKRNDVKIPSTIRTTLDPLALQSENFIESVRKGRDPLVGGKEGLAAMALVQLINKKLYGPGEPSPYDKFSSAYALNPDQRSDLGLF